MRFVAFLRGINVGGHGVVTMRRLSDSFVDSGLRNVSTYRASGNVLFTTVGNDPRRLTASLENRLRADNDLDAKVFLRSEEQLVYLVSNDPFRKLRLGDSKPYVSFLAAPPRPRIRVPLQSDDGTVTLIAQIGSDVLGLGRRVGPRPGFPNPFVESVSGQLATTRNWSTVQGVLAKFRGLPASS